MSRVGGEPEPAGEVDAVHILDAKSAHCSLEQRSARGVAVRNHEREAIEEEIGRAHA